MSTDRVSEVEARLDSIERDLSTIAAAITSGRLLGGGGGGPVVVEADETNRVTRDEAWTCSRCSARLALYNPEEDLLRVRYKDFTAHVRTGVGGLVRIVCRSCSEINEIQHVEKRDPAPPGGAPRRTRS